MKFLLHCLLAFLASCTAPIARAAVYQWSAPVGGDNRRMLLWIPENCQRIRGLIWCADNLTESNIVESPVFRKVCEEERIGIIRSIADFGRHKEGLRPVLSAAWGWGDGLSVEDKKKYDRCEQGIRKPDSEVSKEEKAAMRETLRKFRMSLQDRHEGESNAILKKMAEVSGHVVEHNVVSGPKKLISKNPKFTGNTLRLTPIPPGARYPMKVIVLDYALADDADGTEVAIAIGKETVHAKLKATGSWENYQAVEVGGIAPGKGDDISVSLKCTKKTGSFIMNLRGIKLIVAPAENANRLKAQ